MTEGPRTSSEMRGPFCTGPEFGQLFGQLFVVREPSVTVTVLV